MSNKPFSQPCENNKNAILEKLKTVFSQSNHILEIGSGTGQHAIHFSENMPHICWQTSDLENNHRGINQWIAGSDLPNVMSPIAVDLAAIERSLKSINEVKKYNALNGMFTANTLHIVSLELVEAFLKLAGKLLESGQPLVIYGPFNYQGQFTSESNQGFDLWLRERDINSGIRDIEYIQEQARHNGFSLEDDHEMPANNRLLVFRKA